MVQSYYFADKYNYIVAGTTNKTEALQGFFVKYGDGVDSLPGDRGCNWIEGSADSACVQGFHGKRPCFLAHEGDAAYHGSNSMSINRLRPSGLFRTHQDSSFLQILGYNGR